ncbi:MAG: acireductone synthase [Rhodanobacteraceae bacterium]|nr:acireductone synthase [Rhodanobacteraceae bacterium]
MTRAILTDIEGTTSSVSFVKDVLFPYARDHLDAFVAANAANPEVDRWLAATAQEAGLAPDDVPGLVATLRRWIDEDRKATPLKALQGMIWEAGYRAGAYRAHVYPEVAAQLRAWKAQGLPLYVYSSGSVAAQKLFFRHSEAGDLSVLFDGHFDTEIGAKREASSYARIAAAIGLAPQDILFLSDIVEELDAASSAGLQTIWLCRPPLQCPADSQHPCVGDFDAIAV